MSTRQACDLLRSDDADNVHSGNEYKEGKLEEEHREGKEKHFD